MALKLTKKATPPKIETSVSTELKESGKTISETNEVNDPKDVLGVEGHTGPITVGGGKPWCTVGYAAGYTHNLGNYQSARIDVWVSIPCPHGEIDEVYKQAEAWVDERMTAAMEQFTQG